MEKILEIVGLARLECFVVNGQMEARFGSRWNIIRHSK
jgi:hypothetical protein